MTDDNAKLCTSHNGHLMLTTDSFRLSCKISFLLMFRYGFWRWGIFIPNYVIDEAIYPDYLRGNKRIFSDWEEMSGYEFTASNKESSMFLKEFYNKYFGAETPNKVLKSDS